MPDQQNTQGGAGAAATVDPDGPIPAALLKLVQRPAIDAKTGAVVVEGKGEDAKPKLRAVQAKEVFAWKEYSDRVVVVTTDGQKFVGEKGGK